jgi:hypothetical protein
MRESARERETERAREGESERGREGERERGRDQDFDGHIKAGGNGDHDILAKDGRGDEDPENVVKKRQGEERAGDLA